MLGPTHDDATTTHDDDDEVFMTWLKDEEVGTALEKLQFHEVLGSSIQRIENSYLNFVVLLGLGREEELRYLQLDEFHWRELGPSGDEPQHFSGDAPELRRANQLTFLRLRMEALIRAIYEAASVAVGIAAAESQKNVSLFDWSLKRFAHENPAMLERVDGQAVLGAWAIIEYRNKLIAHHDFCRTYSFASGRNGCRMVPAGPGIFPDLTNEHHTEQARLWGLYGPNSAKPEEINIHNQRKLLFHRVPVVSGGRFNPDRSAIDQLVEQYGTESATLSEIGDAVRSFVLGLAAIV